MNIHDLEEFLELPSSQLELVKKLDLSNEKLVEIPPRIGQCVNLKTLNCNGNPKLVKFPNEIKECVNLKKVTIFGTNIPSSEVVQLLPHIKQKKKVSVPLSSIESKRLKCLQESGVKYHNNQILELNNCKHIKLVHPKDEQVLVYNLTLGKMCMPIKGLYYWKNEQFTAYWTVEQLTEWYNLPMGKISRCSGEQCWIGPLKRIVVKEGETCNKCTL